MTPMRPIRVEDGVAYITLTQGYQAVVDASDAHLIERFSWHAAPGTRTVYARSFVWRNGRKKGIRLHRVIMNAPDDMEVDHINGDGLDNRRCNLRLAKHAENMRNRRMPASNTSGFKGVSWHTRSRKWKAQICIGGRPTSLGLFTTPEAAHAAYVEAAVAFYGEFARAS